MIPIDSAHVQRFRGLVAARLGLFFDDNRLDFLDEVLRRRLAAAAGVATAAAYLDRLVAGAAPGAAAVELRALAHELTIAETYFFRNPDQFHAFTQVVLPARLAARAPARLLRCLSAGCATGEEPYTIAMLLTDVPGLDVEIRAIDVNPAVLERARRGHYTAWSLRQTDAAALERWFEPRAGGFELAASVRQMVTFAESNLIVDDLDTWLPGHYDVVFCRNVLMYFTPAHAEAVVDRIARSLVPGGYLFLGHAETLRGLSQAFHLQHTHGTFYYQLKEPDQEALVDPAAQASRTTTATRPPDGGVPLATLVDQSASWIEAVQRASERIQALANAAAAATAPPAPAPAAAPAPGPARGELRRAIDLHRRERYGDALALVDALPAELGRDAEVLLLRAVLLTDSGRLADAEQACRDLLRVDDLSAGAHYLLALCREGAGDRQRALEHDQTAVYLDPAFAMPRLHLGLLSLRTGDTEAARRALGQALHLLQREDPSRLLLFGGGFKRDALVALCRAQLRACGGEA